MVINNTYSIIVIIIYSNYFNGIIVRLLAIIIHLIIKIIPIMIIMGYGIDHYFINGKIMAINDVRIILMYHDHHNEVIITSNR